MTTTPNQAAPAGLAARVRGTTDSAVSDILALTARPDVISFAGGMPAPELFDVTGIAEAFQHVLVHHPHQALQYSTTEGNPELRAAVADRLTTRGLETRLDDLMMTTGSQQGLALVCQSLLSPGDTVFVEEPCYLTALQVFALSQVRVVPVPGDEEGVDPDALDALAVQERPKLCYLVPTFQNPTGRTMPATRRAAVARVAARRGLWLIEDDPYGELRLEGKDLPWLVQYPGAEDRTVLLGSFSKVIAPGVRLGWLRATATLRMACARVKQATDVHSSTIDQAAVARYLSVTDLEAHLRRLRAAYRARRDALLAGLTAHLPEGTHWNRPEGGMFVWAGFPAGYDAARLLPQAMRHGVAYVPGIPFHVGAADPSLLRLSFAAHSPEQIKEGIRRLALAVARGPGRH